MEWMRTEYAKMVPQKAAELMHSLGYRQTSRKFHHVARVEISTDKMKEYFIKQNFGDANSGVPCGSIESQKEQYRRVHSRDTIENVPEQIMQIIRMR